MRKSKFTEDELNAARKSVFSDEMKKRAKNDVHIMQRIAKHAATFKGRKVLGDSLGYMVASIPLHIYVLAEEVYGRGIWDDKDFLRHYRKHFPENCPHSI